MNRLTRFGRAVRDLPDRARTAADAILDAFPGWRTCLNPRCGVDSRSYTCLVCGSETR